MFRDVIRKTPFTDSVCESYFTRIPYSEFNGDVTFVSTLRALVNKRMGENERIQLHYESSDFGKGTFETNPAQRVIKAMYTEDYHNNCDIIVHNITSGYTEDVDAVFENLEKHFCKTYPNYIRIEKVTDFFRNMFKCMCFVNTEEKISVIFIDHMNIRKLHYLQCGIFAFLPWYFDPQTGVAPEEMELIKSLRERKPDMYLECLENLAKEYDFRTLHIREGLKGFETRFEKKEIERIEYAIRDVLSDIDSIQERLGDYLKRKRELDIKLLGLETKVASEDSEDSEIMEYFLCNRSLHLGNVHENRMTFAAEGYLTYFDEEMARSMIDNPRSYVYVPEGRACNNYIKAEDMKRLMYAIFIDQTLRIKLCAAYEFRFGECVGAIRGYDYGSEMNKCMPNPHIDRYSCMGNYERAINKCIIENNYIGALEQAVASCKSLNFGDSTVMREFIKNMYGIDGYTHNRCVELPDGNVVTPKEAAAWLKEHENGQEESTQETEGTNTNE